MPIIANFNNTVILGINNEQAVDSQQTIPVRVRLDGTIVTAVANSSGILVTTLITPNGSTLLSTVVAQDVSAVNYGAYYEPFLADYQAKPFKVDSAGVQRQNTEPANFSNSAITVTNASQEFAAANSDRKYLLIQNKDSVGNIYVNFGAAATVANGVKIIPGGNYELNNIAPNNSVNIIGDIASNANVVLVTA